MRTRAVVGAMVATVIALSAARAGAAQGFSRVPDGFKASLVDSLGSSCGGSGASAVATDGQTHYFAIDGSLYAKRPQSALRSYSGRVEPWGLALAGDSLFATQPGCDSSSANQDPGPLTDCNLVRVSTENGESLATIADVCGTGVAALGGRLAVATRDGRIVTVGTSGGSTTNVATNLAPVAVQLAWAPDGDTIFFTRLGGDGVWSVPADGGAVRRVADVAARGVIAGTRALGAVGKILVAGGGRLHLVRTDDGATSDVGAASSLAGPMDAAGSRILVAMTEEAWVLNGAFPGPAPKPRRPVLVPAPVPARRPAAPRVAPPAPVAPAQPPPPAPPAPPAPVQAFVVQPGTVTNPALVPAEQERDVALRYAATSARSAGPLEELWLMWIVAATMIAVAGFAIGRRRAHRAPAWAAAWSSTNRPPRTAITREIGLGD